MLLGGNESGEGFDVSLYVTVRQTLCSQRSNLKKEEKKSEEKSKKQKKKQLKQQH